MNSSHMFATRLSSPLELDVNYPLASLLHLIQIYLSDPSPQKLEQDRMLLGVFLKRNRQVELLQSNQRVLG